MAGVLEGSKENKLKLLICNKNLFDLTGKVSIVPGGNGGNSLFFSILFVQLKA